MNTAVETYRPEFLTMYCYGNLILWDYLICMPVRTASLFATRTFYILHYINFVGYLILDKQEKQFLSEEFKDWGTHSNPFFSGLMAMQSGPDSLNKKLASCILWFLFSEVLLGPISCQCLRIFILDSLWILQFTGNQNSLLLDKGCFSNLHSRILQDMYTIISQFCFISLHNTFSFFYIYVSVDLVYIHVHMYAICMWAHICANVETHVHLCVDFGSWCWVARSKDLYWLYQSHLSSQVK